MSIFRRGRKDDEPRSRVGPGSPQEGPDSAPDSVEDISDSAPDLTEEQPVPGPFDLSELDDIEGRLDLGSLLVLGVAGMELRLEVDEAGQQVIGVTAVLGESAVQLQAFAAPRSLGVWDDIRSEIADSIVGQGGTAEEAPGALGTELRTRMPSAGPDGRTVFAPARFVGVDGPRWFLRAVFSGRAAIDDVAAEPLMEVVRGTVVVRGQDAMMPRELLPLRLPQAPDEADADEGDGEGDDERNDSRPQSTSDLNPFERGPEITEVR